MPPVLQLTALAVLATVLMAAMVRIAIRSVKGRDPEKRERRRRMYVHRYGRLGDAVITNATETSLYYSYSVHGVQYSASQDIATLRNRLPTEMRRTIGVANMKYFPQNPANSILICEEWSGIRVRDEPLP